MYDMYPESWGTAGARPGPAERPRRRPRKEHPVLPAVLSRLVDATEQRHVAG